MPQVPRVLPGAESLYFPGGETAVLVCHGFLGTPQSVQHVCRLLAQNGFTVYAPRLQGHGTSYQDLARFTHQDWIKDIHTAYQSLRAKHSRVFIAGQSMGGTLALHAAAFFQDAAGIALINPAIDVPQMKRAVTQTSAAFIKEELPDIRTPQEEEITYSHVPTASVHSLLELTASVSPQISSISCPAFVAASRIDHVVPPANAVAIHENLSSSFKSFVWLEHSYHVATLDADRDFLAKRLSSWMSSVVSADSFSSHNYIM
ncbi:carboxylesterase [uncultured Marinococcus sp.]|uniref:alpha/beta hydrolase n=1 Tax=uncultured Marinococcus sp. TaxID=487012 RepID=UPI00261073A4|nr:alpha/beta fold hydrolase [uncultured Marinococcus sp.]